MRHHLTFLLCALILTVIFYFIYSYVGTTSGGLALNETQVLLATVPPPFYKGGLAQGSSGKVIATAYTDDDLFTPSPASSLTESLLPIEAYSSPNVCARCHVGIHENWSSSMHAVSATDAWYLKVKDLLAFEQGEQEVRLCAGCHAPVALMTGEVGLYNQESLSSQQGVSCLFCHTVETVHSGNGGWVSDPGRVRAYKGGDYLSPEGIENAAHLVMAAPGVHKADMMRPLYKDSQLCMGCHQFELNGVTLQNTYKEWEDSSYAAEGTSCQDCHFTPGAGAKIPDPGHVVEHYPARAHVYRHTLGGGSTEQSPRARDNTDTLREAVELEASLTGQTLEVTVYNRKAGHHLPTGVGDLRELWLEVTAKDAAGETVYSSGVLDAAGYLPEDAVVFRQVLGNDRGEPLVRHDIWQVDQVLEDTRIPADGSVTSTFDLPPQASWVTVKLLWRDAPAEFMQRVLQRPGTDLQVSELAVWRTELDR